VSAYADLLTNGTTFSLSYRIRSAPDPSWKRIHERAVLLNARHGVRYVDHIFGEQNPAQSAPLIDWPALTDRVGGDFELLREVLGLFIADAPGHLGEMDGAIAAGDVVALARTAHTFHGAAANFGAAAVVKLVTEIEHIARGYGTTAGIAAARPLLSALETEVLRLNTVLATLRQEMPS